MQRGKPTPDWKVCAQCVLIQGVTRDNSTRQRTAIAALLVLVTLAIYWRVTQHGFVIYDDPEYVRLNRTVQQGLSLDGLRWAFASTDMSNWHPLTWLSHMTDCQLFGLRAGAHHLVSLLLHVANTLLLFHLLRRMTGKLGCSAFVAALFAWHPLHVESVVWVAERKDVLSAFFWMLTLLAYVRYVERPGTWRYLTMVSLFALGLLAKPMVVTLPFVMLLLDFWPLRRVAHRALAPTASPDDPSTASFPKKSLGSLCLEKVPLLALAAASSAVTFWVQQAGHAVTPLARFSVGFRVANALDGYLSYLWKTIWPVELGVFYPLPASHPAGQVALAAVVLAGITVWALLTLRSRPYWATGWFWFLGTLVPVIGLVQVGDQAMADRYSYLPLTGVGIILAWGMAELVERKPSFKWAVQVAGAAVVVFWVVLAGRQVSYWKDNQTLFQHTLAVTGRNYLAETVLGNSLASEGRIADAKRLFLRALEARPTYHEAHFGLGNAYAAEGKLDEAIGCYRRALQLNPRLIDAYNALGGALFQQGKYQEAATQFGEALKIDPAFAEAQFNWSLVMERLGNAGPAMAGYRKVLKLRPDSTPAGTRLAWMLATNPDAKLRNGPEALNLAQRVCQQTAHRDAECLNALAAAYAENGRWAEAIQSAQTALALAQAGSAQEIAKVSQLLLKSYTAGKLYREGG